MTASVFKDRRRLSIDILVFCDCINFTPSFICITYFGTYCVFGGVQNRESFGALGQYGMNCRSGDLTSVPHPGQYDCAVEQYINPHATSCLLVRSVYDSSQESHLRHTNLNCKSWYIRATAAQVQYTKVLTLLNVTVQTMHR